MTFPPELAALVASELLFSQNFFKIRDIKGQQVRLVLNQPQRLWEERAAGNPSNYTIKARKGGISTRIIASDIHACATKSREHAILLTHTDDAAEKMMTERIEPMLKNCEFPLNYKIKQGLVHFTDTDSRYYVGTAGSRKFGRGDDVTRWHFSELAHWENPEVMTGVEEAGIDGAVGRIETTANGINFAKKLWDDSKAGKNRYKPIFIPWYADTRYRIPGAVLASLTEDEQNLIEAFGLSQEQLAWRREKIRTMSQPELFPQEYPATDTEAFLSSGRMVFDWVSLMRQENHCGEPKVYGHLRDHGERVELAPGSPARLKVWHTPQPGHVYIIGGDIAEGLEDGAFSAAFVFDLGEGHQVAEWHGHIAPDLFGDELVKLGRYYNNALLAPESWPGPGAVTMQRVLELNYRHFYQADGSNHEGWETNSRTKQDAVLSFAAAVRDMRLILKSKDLIGEMRSFVYDEKGRMNPSLGTFSDRVMAAAIGWRVGVDRADLAQYDRPRLRDAIVGRGDSAISVPDWHGPLLGRRQA